MRNSPGRPEPTGSLRRKAIVADGRYPAARPAPQQAILDAKTLRQKRMAKALQGKARAQCALSAWQREEIQEMVLAQDLAAVPSGQYRACVGAFSPRRLRPLGERADIDNKTANVRRWPLRVDRATKVYDRERLLVAAIRLCLVGCRRLT